MQYCSGIVAQLVRVPPCHGGSCEFESRQSRYFKSEFYIYTCIYILIIRKKINVVVII